MIHPQLLFRSSAGCPILCAAPPSFLFVLPFCLDILLGLPFLAAFSLSLTVFRLVFVFPSSPLPSPLFSCSLFFCTFDPIPILAYSVCALPDLWSSATSSRSFFCSLALFPLCVSRKQTTQKCRAEGLFCPIVWTGGALVCSSLATLASGSLWEGRRCYSFV